jgi:integrase
VLTRLGAQRAGQVSGYPGHGADIRDIRDLLGHESVATTEIYTHVSAARRRRVVQLLEGPGDIRSPSVSPA